MGLHHEGGNDACTHRYLRRWWRSTIPHEHSTWHICGRAASTPAPTGRVRPRVLYIHCKVKQEWRLSQSKNISTGLAAMPPAGFTIHLTVPTAHCHHHHRSPLLTGYSPQGHHVSRFTICLLFVVDLLISSNVCCLMSLGAFCLLNPSEVGALHIQRSI